MYKYKISELKFLAKEKHIAGWSKMKKAELYSALDIVDWIWQYHNESMNMFIYFNLNISNEMETLYQMFLQFPNSLAHRTLYINNIELFDVNLSTMTYTAQSGDVVQIRRIRNTIS